MLDDDKIDMGKLAPAIALPIIIGIGGAVCFSNREADYVVAAKDVNKIEYYSIKNPSNMHVMTFDGDTVLKHGGWYPYLNVGDTISGPAAIMDKPVVESTCYQGLRPPIIRTTIELKNGKSLTHYNKNAWHNDMSRKMKTKQR